AVGGYTTATLVADHGVRDLWTIPIAAGVAGGIGLVVGLPAHRLSGFSQALLTFGIAVVLPTILRKFDHLTGGSSGITLVGSSAGDRLHYALTWTIGAVLFLVA